MRKCFVLLLAFFSILQYAYSFEKQTIRVTGSASVYPIVSYIYENTPDEIKKTYFKSNPVIESVGTGAGFDAFCKQKFNSNSPDIVNASRPINRIETQNCNTNNIKNIKKITVGLDGIVFAHSGKNKRLERINLTTADLQRALSKYIVQNGKVIQNKTTHWDEIKRNFPKVKIIIYGPNSNSGTYGFLQEIIRDECMSNNIISSYIKSLGKDVKNECSSFRKEVYIEMPDQDSMISRKIHLQNAAIGVLRFSFFENSGKSKAVPIDGVLPTEEGIVSQKYKFARPLFVYYDASYINKVEGMRQFLTQICKFSYRDLITEKNEYQDQESLNLVVENKGNNLECLANKEVIGFEFNCEK